MAITFKWVNNVPNGVAATGATVTKGANAIADGDFLVAIVAPAPTTNSDPGSVSLGTGGGSAWTQVSNDFVFNTANGNGFRRAIFQKVALGESTDYAATWTNSDKFSWALLNYGSVNAQDVAGATIYNLNSFAQTLANAPSVSPVGSADLEICVYCYNGASGGTNTLPAALTSRLNPAQTDSTAPWIGVGEIQLSASGATSSQQMTSTNTGSGFWIWTADSIALTPTGAASQTPYNPWPQLGPMLAQRSRTGWTPKVIDWHRRQRPGRRALLVPDRRLMLPQGFKKAA